MSGTFEHLDICSDPAFARDLLNKAYTEVSLPEFQLTARLEDLLNQNHLLLQVRYLLTVGVSTKSQFYGSCTKNIVKFPNKKSKIFYYWDSKLALWKEEDRAELLSTYLSEIIENIYVSICVAVGSIKDVALSLSKNSKTKKLISTIDELALCLINVKEVAITPAKMKQVVNKYIKYVVDEKFESLINPQCYLAVEGKQVINLKTGESRTREKTDYFTQEIPVRYNPNAHSELLMNTINQIMVYDTEMIAFLQEFFGYAISGDCQEGKVTMFIGSSRAGKSVLLKLLGMLLHKFAVSLNKSVIIDSKRGSDAPDPFVAELKNKRVGIINELQQNDMVSTSKFKTLATNEEYSYRVLHSNDVEKTSSRHVILLASNHKPVFPETDDSIWERLIIMNFKARFTDNPKNDNEYKIDRKLLTKLDTDEEKQAFLKWVVDGSIRYFKQGKLMIPKSCLDALDEYKFISQDDTELYFYYRLEVTKDSEDRIQVSLLHKDYKDWCITNAVDPISRKDFANFLLKKNIGRFKSNNTYYTHVKYKENDSSDG